MAAHDGGHPRQVILYLQILTNVQAIRVTMTQPVHNDGVNIFTCFSDGPTVTGVPLLDAPMLQFEGWLSNNFI